MPYFLFSFTITDNGHSLATEWMDEHVIGKVTLQDRTYLSCDSVRFALMPSNGAICNSSDLSTNGGDYSIWESVSLIREGADESEFDPDAHIPWHNLPDIGEPDELIMVENGYPGAYPTGWAVTGLLFTWDESWTDDYWFLNYRFDGRLRRTQVLFTDAVGYNHRYYAIPWAHAID